MNLDEFFKKSWKDYVEITPSAKRIVALLEKEGEVIINDHIALRTFSHSKVKMDLFSDYFISKGYLKKDHYFFPETKLNAFHFEHKEGPERPKIFISELDLGAFDSNFQTLILRLMEKVPSHKTFEDLYELGNPWLGVLSFKDYEFLREKSEYAAWLAGMGIRANHFTISLNNFKKYNTIQKMNDFLKFHHFSLNTVGGEIKGTPGVFLEQSSLMADRMKTTFSDGEFEVSTCYYEFALRYKCEDGKYFQGFVANSAGNIFESTYSKG